SHQISRVRNFDAETRVLTGISIFSRFLVIVTFLYPEFPCIHGAPSTLTWSREPAGSDTRCPAGTTLETARAIAESHGEGG
ncbi:MAG: hypothetical protein ACRD3O_11090, partial [Terriglobia bacterium]